MATIATINQRPSKQRGRLQRTLGDMRREWTAYLFLSPALLLFAVFTVFAVGYSFYLSFHQWNILEPAKPFVGLDNYQRLFEDRRFRQSIFNTAYYTLLTVPASMVLGLLIALLLNQQIRARGLFRTCFYLPVVTPLVVAAIIWKWVYNGDYGLLNYYLMKIGVIDDSLLWLSDKKLAMPAVAIMTIWKSVGFNMVIYLAGLQAIPQEYYDAAKIDGANGIRRLKDITVPLLSSTTFFLLIISIIGSFQVFTQIFIMTNGGPVNRTNTIVYEIYTTAFKNFEMGYASAMAYALFAMMFILTLLQMRFFYKEVDY